MKPRAVVGRGKEGPLCDPGSELLLGGREGGREKCEDNKWDEKKKSSSYNKRPHLIQFLPRTDMARIWPAARTLQRSVAVKFKC